MTEDPTAIAGEFVSWAERRTTPLTGNVADAVEVLRLTAHIVDEPSELRAGDLTELLLDVYPSQTAVLDPDQATGMVGASRDVLAFLRDTGRVDPAVGEVLSEELDEIEPSFLDASFDDELNLADALGLPEQLPALRLPPEPELAVTTRESALLRRVVELARWVGERRTITEDDGELSAADAAAAARSIGISVPPAVHGMADVPELVHLWHLAFATDLVEHLADGGVGANMARWPSGDDDDDLDTWSIAFGQTLSGLSLDAELAGRDDLDFSGFGALPLMLFLARSEGLSFADLSGLAEEAATDGLAPAEADDAWTSWTEAHGDPARTLVERLAEHGAVDLDGETARLTPLGMWAMRDQVNAAGVTVPLLPPVADMTAADLLTAADGLAEDELEAETEQWLALRAPETAVDELLDAAATCQPAERLLATAMVARLGSAAEPKWRDALTRPELRSYAKFALNQLSGLEPPEFGPGLEPLPEDLAWLLTDVLAATFDAFEDDEIEQQFRDAVPAGQEQEVFDAMWRLPHPEVADVLTMLGESHPDKKIAKAARKAAFRAGSAP